MDIQNKAAVIGGLNADIWGRPSGPIILRDSNPGSVTLTPGGVGRNIAHDLCLLGLDVSLVSAVGDDSNGEFLLDRCRGLDVGAIEYIHSQLVSERDKGKAILLVSLELDEVMSLSDRILVMYEGKIVGEFDPKKITVQELGLYMAGAKRADEEGEAV